MVEAGALLDLRGFERMRGVVGCLCSKERRVSEEKRGEEGRWHTGISWRHSAEDCVADIFSSDEVLQ